MKKTNNLLQKHFDTALESPDGIKKLRELILTLAMQGKLVPQDPNDPPASQLLKEIQAEKERLIAEGKIKKQKVLPEIKPEEVPYEVPEGWVWTRLGEVSHVIAGYSFNSQHFKLNEGVKCIKITNAGVHEFIETKDRLPIDFLEKYSNFIVNKSDLIIALTRPFIKNGLKICSCPISYHKSLLNQRVAAIKGTINKTGYLFSYLKSKIVLKVYQNRFGDIGLQPNLKMNDITELFIPLPPLAEQKRIVARIDELMALCDKLEEQRANRDQKCLAVHASAINRLLTAADKNEFHSSWQFITRHFDPLYSVKENVAELKKAILTLAMQGKLVTQDPNDPPASQLLKEIQAEKERLIAEGKIKKQKALPEIKPEDVPYEVPEGWVPVRLGEIGFWKSGSTPSRTNSKYYGGGIPWVKSGEVKQGRISSTMETITKEALEKCSLSINDKGSVLVAMYGANIGEVGILDIEATTNQAVCACKTYSQFNENYLLNLITSLKPYFIQQGAGAAQPNISREKIIATPIMLPPLAEQKRIVAKIDELMTLCDKLENQINLATKKQTALFNAVLAKV